jgi:flagellar assembly protein FliH
MATLIRLADAPHALHDVPLNFDDLDAQAAQIVAQAQSEAEAIRQRAAEEGCQAAVQAIEKMAAEQFTPVLAALQQAGTDLRHAKQAWLAHWEQGAVHLAAAIAARVIRGELRRQPEITIKLVREALELAAGSPSVRLHLNPEDYKSLGAQVRTLIDAMSGLGAVEVAADATIGRGGCRVETRFGTIDQQFESQLKRIEEELTG